MAKKPKSEKIKILIKIEKGKIVRKVKGVEKLNLLKKVWLERQQEKLSSLKKVKVERKLELQNKKQLQENYWLLIRKESVDNNHQN